MKCHFFPAILRSIILTLSVMLGVATLSGCEGYQLRGKVVEGPVSTIMIVDQNDPKLREPGVAGTFLKITTDPGRMSQKYIGGQQTNLDGEFAVPINEPGAGLLEYTVEVHAQALGFSDAVQTFDLPGGNKRVLVILAEGTAGRKPRNAIDESLDIGRREGVFDDDF